MTYTKFLGGGGGPFVGWYLFVWGVFSFYMWIATFRHNTVAAADVSGLVDHVPAARDRRRVWHSAEHIRRAATWGSCAAALAVYLSAAEIINGDFGRTVLPVGPYVA